MKQSALTVETGQQLTPAGFNQREAAFMYRVYGKAGMFCHFVDIDLPVNCKPADLEAQLQALINANESLRGYLVPFDQTHAYLFHDADYVARHFQLQVIDLSSQSMAEQDEAMRAYWQQEEARGFDIYQDLPLRAALARLGEGRSKLLLSIHHLACDERSLERLIAHLLGQEVPGGSSARHGDATSQASVNMQDLADFWQRELQLCPSLYSYPVSETRQENRTFAITWHAFTVEGKLADQVARVLSATGATAEEFFLGAFQLFMHSYCQQDYCAIGINTYPGSAGEAIGNNVNRLPLVSHWADADIKQWLADLRSKLTHVHEHAAIPFGEIVDVVHADKAVNYHPLFQALYSYTQVPDEQHWFKADNSTAPAYSHFDIRLAVTELKNGAFVLNFGLSNELFKPSTQDEFIGYFGNLLNQLTVDGLDTKAHRLLLTNDEQFQQLQSSWNQAIAAPESFPTIHGCFEENVAKHPERIAVYHYDETLTYAQLNARANQCAHQIHSMLGRQQAKVAVETDNPLDMLITLLGIIKAGCVYIPSDPALPVKRVEYILENSETDLFITHAKERYTQDVGCELMRIEDFMQAAAQQGQDNLNLSCSPTDLAYYIYTSGSTGKPKGVMAVHAGVVNIAWGMKKICQLKPESCFLLFASFGFDASVNDWAGALCNGSSVALIKRSNTNIADEVKNAFKRHPVSVALIPPSFLSFFHPSDFPTMHTLMVGAEPVHQKLIEKWVKDVRLLNVYGPTETTVVCCSFPCDPSYPHNTIGKAVDNYVLMVLDKHLNPLPPNVVGELYIGGAGLAAGYVAAPELTAECFIEADIAGYGPVRLYKSNDLVKLSTEGNIEFVKRNDKVEKIRGFRVSLTEIDQTLEQHPYVDHAATISSDDDDKSILSYVVLNSRSMSRFDTVEQWRNIFENSIDYESRNDEKTFNVSGWSSSYTGGDIPDEQMKVWLKGTTDSILSLRPKKLLEVGCGSGLLLFKVAPKLEKYVGTDISKDALLSIKKSMPEGGIPGVSIAVHRLQANELGKFEDQSFDTIICNSVIQYFPSMDYFAEVLDGFFRVLEPGGKLFLGDIRNKNLAAHFHALVEQAKSKEVGASDIQFKVDQRVHKDPELLVDPEFFYYLKQRHPQISRVRILHKRGYDHNEMNQFRYDVVIETNTDANKVDAPEYQWHQLASMAAVESQLKQNRALVIRDIPNARITPAVEVLGDKHIETFRSAAMEPEAFFELGERFGLYTEITYSVAKDHCYFDVGFCVPGSDVFENEWPTATSLDLEIPRRGNIPYVVNREYQCLAQLNDYLKQELPGYMRPRQIFCIDSIPYNLSGKLDRSRLPTSKTNQRLAQTEFRELNSVTEHRLGAIWKRVLDVDQVGVDDNFFDLGGNSFMFLWFISDLEEEFGVKLSVMDIMRSTLGEISQKIDGLLEVH